MNDFLNVLVVAGVAILGMWIGSEVSDTALGIMIDPVAGGAIGALLALRVSSY